MKRENFEIVWPVLSVIAGVVAGLFVKLTLVPNTGFFDDVTGTLPVVVMGHVAMLMSRLRIK